jgi:hypothetical protein
MRELIFEDPSAAVVFLGIVCAGLVLAGMVRRRGRLLAAGALCGLLAGALVAADAAVLTGREQIRRTMDAIAADAVAGRVDTLQARLDEDFQGLAWRGVGPGREAALIAARGVLAVYDLHEIRYSNVRIDLDRPAGRAEVRFNTLIYLGPPSQTRPAGLKWTSEWIRRGEDWNLYRLEKPEAGLDL